MIWAQVVLCLCCDGWCSGGKLFAIAMMMMMMMMCRSFDLWAMRMRACLLSVLFVDENFSQNIIPYQ